MCIISKKTYVHTYIHRYTYMYVHTKIPKKIILTIRIGCQIILFLRQTIERKKSYPVVSFNILWIREALIKQNL